MLKKYVKKGSKIYVEGELQTRKWQDQEGKDRYTTEVVLQGYNCNLTLLDSRNQSNTNTTNNQTDVTGNTNNMEDLFLRDSVIVSVNTRNIGKGSF